MVQPSSQNWFGAKVVQIYLIHLRIQVEYGCQFILALYWACSMTHSVRTDRIWHIYSTGFALLALIPACISYISSLPYLSALS